MYDEYAEVVVRAAEQRLKWEMRGAAESGAGGMCDFVLSCRGWRGRSEEVKSAREDVVGVVWTMEIDGRSGLRRVRVRAISLFVALFKGEKRKRTHGGMFFFLIMWEDVAMKGG